MDLGVLGIGDLGGEEEEEEGKEVSRFHFQ